MEGNDEQKERARTGGKGNTVNAIFNEIVNAGEIPVSVQNAGKSFQLRILMVLEKFAGGAAVSTGNLKTLREIRSSAKRNQPVV